MAARRTSRPAAVAQPVEAANTPPVADAGAGAGTSPVAQPVVANTPPVADAGARDASPAAEPSKHTDATSGDALDLSGRMIVVRTAGRAGFRRAGHAFGPEPVVLAVDAIGLEAAAAILSEGALIVEIVASDAPAD